MPMDLKTKKYQNKIYYLTEDGQKRLPYIEYLEEVYGIVNRDKVLSAKVVDSYDKIISLKKKHNILK